MGVLSDSQAHLSEFVKLLSSIGYLPVEVARRARAGVLSACDLPCIQRVIDAILGSEPPPYASASCHRELHSLAARAHRALIERRDYIWK